MRRALRENAICASMAGIGCATMAWLGLYGFAWNDYDNEARPAFDAIVHGHVAEFMRLAPAYGGSLVERAPFALVPGLWGGGELAVYRAVALPCLAAAALLGVWLVAGMRTRGATVLARAVALGVCVANPLTLRALELGHPEELLGGAMCVAAVALAARDRWLLAGLVLGLAIANKQWAVLAAAPVLLALSPRLRTRALASATLTATAVLAPLTFAAGGFAARAGAVASAPSGIFQPWQLFWFLGRHEGVVRGAFGAIKPGYRSEPPWIAGLSHPLVVLAGLLVALAGWLAAARRGAGESLGDAPARSGPVASSGAPLAATTSRLAHLWRTRLASQQALLVLTLAMLLRCLLDTWDAAYYPLPFALALLTWELFRDARRPPVLALSASILLWVSFQWLPEHASADMQAAWFLAWTLPLSGWLATRLLSASEAGPRARSASHGGERRAQETTVSSLGRLVSTS